MCYILNACSLFPFYRALTQCTMHLYILHHILLVGLHWPLADNSTGTVLSINYYPCSILCLSSVLPEVVPLQCTLAFDKFRWNRCVWIPVGLFLLWMSVYHVAFYHALPLMGLLPWQGSSYKRYILISIGPLVKNKGEINKQNRHKWKHNLLGGVVISYNYKKYYYTYSLYYTARHN